ncbi:MAG: hypothetical protein AAGM67_17765, partial [Bacteroidota bacterium]
DLVRKLKSVIIENRKEQKNKKKKLKKTTRKRKSKRKRKEMRIFLLSMKDKMIFISDSYHYTYISLSGAN